MILGKEDERREAAYNSAVLTEGVVVVGHDICEGIRDVTTLDDLLGFVRVVRKLHTTEQLPLSRDKRGIPAGKRR